MIRKSNAFLLVLLFVSLFLVGGVVAADAASKPNSADALFRVAPITLKLQAPITMVQTEGGFAIMLPDEGETIGGRVPVGSWMTVTVRGSFELRRFHFKWNGEPTVFLKAIGCRLLKAESVNGPWVVASIDSQVVRPGKDAAEVVSALEEVQGTAVDSIQLWLNSPEITRAIVATRPRRLRVTAKTANLIENLPMLECLEIDCSETKDLNFLSKHDNLKSLTLTDCTNITDYSGLKNCSQLTLLNLESANKLESLADLANLTKLRCLGVLSNGLRDISALTALSNLQILNLTIPETTDISVLETMTKLKALSINGNITAAHLKHIGELTHLEWLQVYGAAYGPNGRLLNGDLKDLAFLSRLTELTDLQLFECAELVDVTELKSCPKLRSVVLSSCNALTTVSTIQHLKDLEFLDLSFSKKIADILSARTLSHLVVMNIKRCENIPDQQIEFIIKELPNCKVYVTSDEERREQKAMENLLDSIKKR